MPESPVLSQDITIEDHVPHVPSFPLREGEQKHEAALVLDQNLRRDSELETLKAQVAALTGQQKPMYNMKEGPGAIKRRQLLQDKVSELKNLTRKVGTRWEGPCTPFTVVNFNPVKLTLTGELADQFVPAAGQSLKKVTFPYNGRSFVGSYVTLWNPKVWPVPIGIENINGEDVPTFRADYLTPMGISHQFYEHYVEGAVSALSMGGVFIFEGDVHTLSQRRTDRTGGNVWTPVVDSELSRPAHPRYKVEERQLTDLLRDALLHQRRYAEAIIAQGHSFYHSANAEEQKQLTDYHVMWHNWAMQMGYKADAEEWASERLTDSPSTQAVLCPSCSTRQAKPDQHFCASCNAPFDAFKSFMAGMPVGADCERETAPGREDCAFGNCGTESRAQEQESRRGRQSQKLSRVLAVKRLVKEQL